MGQSWERYLRADGMSRQAWTASSTSAGVKVQPSWLRMMLNISAFSSRMPSGTPACRGRAQGQEETHTHTHEGECERVWFHFASSYLWAVELLKLDENLMFVYCDHPVWLFQDMSCIYVKHSGKWHNSNRAGVFYICKKFTERQKKSQVNRTDSSFFLSFLFYSHSRLKSIKKIIFLDKSLFYSLYSFTDNNNNNSNYYCYCYFFYFTNSIINDFLRSRDLWLVLFSNLLTVHILFNLLIVLDFIYLFN